MNMNRQYWPAVAEVADPVVWGPWITYAALYHYVEWERHTMEKFNLQMKPMSSLPNFTVFAMDDVDIWQGPEIWELELQAIERLTDLRRTRLLFRYQIS